MFAGVVVLQKEISAILKIAELVSTFQQLSPAEQRSVLNTLERAVEANAQPERLTDLRVKYPGEWLAIVIPDGEDRYAPEHGYLLAHDSDRLTVWQEVNTLAADQDVFVFFSGPTPAKGFAITFHDTADSLEVATLVE